MVVIEIQFPQHACLYQRYISKIPSQPPTLLKNGYDRFVITKVSSDMKEMSSRLDDLEKVVRECIQREKKVSEPPSASPNQEKRRLQDSKWAVSGCSPVEDRRARGLCGTYREEVAGSWLARR